MSNTASDTVRTTPTPKPDPIVAPAGDAKAEPTAEWVTVTVALGGNVSYLNHEYDPGESFELDVNSPAVFLLEDGHVTRSDTQSNPDADASAKLAAAAAAWTGGPGSPGTTLPDGSRAPLVNDLASWRNGPAYDASHQQIGTVADGAYAPNAGTTTPDGPVYDVTGKSIGAIRGGVLTNAGDGQLGSDGRSDRTWPDASGSAPAAPGSDLAAAQTKLQAALDALTAAQAEQKPSDAAGLEAYYRRIGELAGAVHEANAAVATAG